MTKITRIALVGLLLLTTMQLAGAQTKPAQEQPFVIEYYYKVKWGYADEFMALFRKNHLPVLKKQMETGRITNLKIDKPRYHSTEEGRWDFRVTISFRNVAAAFDSEAEPAVIKELYRDQVTYRREEQRRFELLISHWDVPMVSVPLNP